MSDWTSLLVSAGMQGNRDAGVLRFSENERLAERTPVITPCPQEEAEAAAIADELFAGIAPWKFRGTILHLGFWDFLSQWVGVENCYFNLIDELELLHALMRRLTDATIEMIRQMNEYELFDTQSFTCHCTYTFSDKTPGGKSVSQNAWAFGMAQIFSFVSPDVTAEFEVPYAASCTRKHS